MNMIEGFFSIFKCGMKGVYQYCGQQYLYCYLVEFDFCYSGCYEVDIDCVEIVMCGIIGKWLIYKLGDVI